MAIRFTNILRDLIIEGTRFQVLFDTYVKPNKETRKGAMSLQVLFDIIKADPTSKIPEDMDTDNVKPEDMERVKIGKYTKWLLKKFTNPTTDLLTVYEYQNLFLEDLYKVTNDLMKFERFKNRLPQEYRDINKLTPETLYNQVKDFSLEKTKASAEEKKEASKTYAHPGADIVYRGSNWTVAKISDTGQLGKDAACFYGGYHLEPQRGETRWCTSSPGTSWFDNYIKKGPLYVVIPNTPKAFSGVEIGEKSGLPSARYQFHFPDKQFMDAADRQINLVNFLNSEEPGLKEYFKPEMMKGLVNKDRGSDRISVNYPGDAASNFIALYGFKEFFETLPKDIRRLEFINNSSDELNLEIPDTIGNYTSLTALVLIGCVSKIPDTICKLEKLQFLSLPKNPNLQPLPDCMGGMSRLSLINLIGSNPHKTLPESVKNRLETDENFVVYPEEKYS